MTEENVPPPPDSSFSSPYNAINSHEHTENNIKEDIKANTTLDTTEDEGTDIKEDEEIELLPEGLPEDDAFIFRKMGKKVKNRLKHMTAHYLSSKNSSCKDSLAEQASCSEYTNKGEQSQKIIKQSDNMNLVLWSAIRVPLYSLQRDEYGALGVPALLALLSVDFYDFESEKAGNYSPNMCYSVKLTYGALSWTITRRIYDFFRLHMILLFRNLHDGFSSHQKLPDFPPQFSYIIDSAGITGGSKTQKKETRIKASEERKNALKAYFQQLLSVINMKPHLNEIFEFLELSSFSLSLASAEGVLKRKEGYLKFRLVGTQKLQPFISCTPCCGCGDGKKFDTKWFVIKSGYIALLSHVDQSSPVDVFLADKDFHLIVKNENSNQFLRPLTVIIYNSSRKLELRPDKNTQIDFWLAEFRQLALDCIYCRPQRFGSFAPLRSGVKMEWLIDGEEYYNALVREIKNAREEIYIHGWWISPELYLVRPAALHPNMRLDRLLQAKAKEGVKIYIMVFKEFAMALSLNSQHTKTWLEKLHPNIRVQRHPDHLDGILYWAHHEKLAIIDQSVAFTGGLDLCFGRYDSQSHRLMDFYPNDDQREIWTGLDYANPRIRDFRNVTQHMEALVNRQVVPRMPWHDVHCVVYGNPARDLSRHFIERWNFVKQQKAMHKEVHIPFLLPRDEMSDAELTRLDYKSSIKIQAVRSVSEWSMGTAVESSIYDAYLYFIEKAQRFIYIENQFFISKSSRTQSSPIKNTIAQAIVDRILLAHERKEVFKVIVFLPLMPAFEAAVNSSEASSLRMIMQAQYSAISRGPHSILGLLNARGIRAEEYISFYSLRKYDFIDGKPITEQLYIHTKLLIVDDLVAIMGSANINDRSMLGSRDSELSIIVEDDNLKDAEIAGKLVKVSNNIQNLRLRLFQEHLGMLNLPLTDPLIQKLVDPTHSDFYYGILKRQASLNTQIYRELFHCVPDDCVDSWEEYQRFTETPRTHIIDDELGINSYERLDSIKGSVVLFPTQFLRKEDLAASMLAPEYLLPVEVFL